MGFFLSRSFQENVEDLVFLWDEKENDMEFQGLIVFVGL